MVLPNPTGERETINYFSLCSLIPGYIFVTVLEMQDNNKFNNLKTEQK